MTKEHYEGAIRGGLKFKGDGVKKKKKKHVSKVHESRKLEEIPKGEAADGAVSKSQGSETGRPQDEPTAEQLNALRESRMTESEKAFARTRRERLLKDAGKDGLKTYEERKHDFAKQLAEAPEHNDMPKVGPG